jgi:ABC-type histidine transport system ATPase subunit
MQHKEFINKYVLKGLGLKPRDVLEILGHSWSGNMSTESK